MDEGGSRVVRKQTVNPWKATWSSESRVTSCCWAHARWRVSVDHEEIPGYMQAMRMTYPVADAKLLEGLSPGDSVLGKLKVGSRSYILTRLAKR